VFSAISVYLEAIVFKGLYFFLTFSLDRNNIGCPLSSLQIVNFKDAMPKC
jgi:hypothetical protein